MPSILARVYRFLFDLMSYTFVYSGSWARSYCDHLPWHCQSVCIVSLGLRIYNITGWDWIFDRLHSTWTLHPRLRMWRNRTRVYSVPSVSTNRQYKWHQVWLSVTIFNNKARPIYHFSDNRCFWTHRPKINTWQQIYRRWAGKTSYVHFAPEHEFTIKQKRRPE